MNKELKLTKFNKLFPWFAGLSDDLLFWIAIDTLFLTVVKDFNASQIVSLTSISLITCILLQVPLLNIIKIAPINLLIINSSLKNSIPAKIIKTVDNWVIILNVEASIPLLTVVFSLSTKV